MTTTQIAHGTCPVCGHVGELVECLYEDKVYLECKDTFGCWKRYIERRDQKKEEA